MDKNYNKVMNTYEYSINNGVTSIFDKRNDKKHSTEKKKSRKNLVLFTDNNQISKFNTEESNKVEIYQLNI